MKRVHYKVLRSSTENLKKRKMTINKNHSILNLFKPKFKSKRSESIKMLSPLNKFKIKNNKKMTRKI